MTDSEVVLVLAMMRRSSSRRRGIAPAAPGTGRHTVKKKQGPGPPLRLAPPCRCSWPRTRSARAPGCTCGGRRRARLLGVQMKAERETSQKQIQTPAAGNEANSKQPALPNAHWPSLTRGRVSRPSSDSEGEVQDEKAVGRDLQPEPTVITGNGRDPLELGSLSITVRVRG